MRRRLFLSSLAAAPLAAQERLSGTDAASQVLAAQITTPGRVQAVLTRSGNNLRTCAYLNETILSPASIAANPPRLLYTMRGVGDPRIEAQPLLVPGVTIEDGTVHDLCIVADMSGHLCAYDANNADLLWMKRLGQPVQGSRSIDMFFINPAWSILSTPVIDAGVVYAVAWISPDGTPANSRFYLHALALRDGLHVHAPLALTPVNTLVQRKQRAALTLSHINGRPTIFIPWCTIQESNANAHGYITAVDVSDWKVRAELNLSATGSGAGVWQGGGGIVDDGAGSLYCITGNGDFDGAGSFGESFVKLKYDYAAASLKPVNWWSPFLDKARGATGGWDDMDFGAAPPAIIPQLNIAILCGKDGIGFVVPLDAIGQTKPADFVSGINHKGFKQAFFYTYYAAGKEPVPASAMDLNFFYANRTHNQHSGSVIFRSDAGWRAYCWGENGNARAWSVDASGLKYLACGQEQASAQSPVGNGQYGGMTGGMMCLSANGTGGAVLWGICPLGNANTEVTQGYLVAYDALNFGKYADGSGQLRTLWRSENFTFSKFNVPVVSGGRIFVPCYDGTVRIYG